MASALCGGRRQAVDGVQRQAAAKQRNTLHPQSSNVVHPEQQLGKLRFLLFFQYFFICQRCSWEILSKEVSLKSFLAFFKMFPCLEKLYKMQQVQDTA